MSSRRGDVDSAKRLCAHCAKPLSRKRYGGRLEDAATFLRRTHCSLSCANSREAPTNWETYHWRARKLRKPACEACGETRRLQAHHVDQNRTNNTPENIQTLCKWCHDFLHATAKRRGLTVAGRLAPLGLPATSPIGWTDCEPLAMDRFHVWLHSHGAC